MILSEEDLALIEEICKNPPPITIHMKKAIDKHRSLHSYNIELSKDDTNEIKKFGTSQRENLY